MTTNDNDNNVVQFPTPDTEPLVWICSCGCQSFRLLSSGKSECCQCHHICTNHGGDWRNKLPDASPTELTDAGTVSIVAVGEVLAKRRVFKEIESWAHNDELVGVFAYNKNGCGKHWYGIATEEQREYCIEKLLDLIDSIKATAI